MKIGESFNPFKMFVGLFIPNALVRCRELPASAKLLWGRLAQYAGKDGRIFPKQETLADELGLTRNQIVDLLGKLQKFGLLKKIPATGRDRLLHKSNTYLFLWHPIFEPEITHPGANSTVRPGANSTVRPGANSTVRPIEENPIEENPIEENPIEKTDMLAKSASTAYPPGFIEAWEAYPKGRRLAKQKCLTYWKRDKLEPRAAEIVGKIEAFRETQQWKDGYAPEMTKWLHQRYWDGELDEICDPDKPAGDDSHDPDHTRHDAKVRRLVTGENDG